VKIDDPRLITPQCTSLKPVEKVHENPWFVVRNRGGYFTTEYRHLQVIILPVVAHKYILMVRVKRPVINDVTLELPAGSGKENEDPYTAAAREFEEETGIKIVDHQRFVAIPPVAGSPNRNPNLLHIFKIDLTIEEFGNRGENDQEIEAVELLDFNGIKQKLITGDIYVAVPTAVISRFFLSHF